MLRSCSLYNIKGENIEIRLPNPNDIIINWSVVSKEFKKDFVSFWHQTYVLSKNVDVKHHSYNINTLAYKNLLILDHIGYMVNNRLIKENELFDDAFDRVANSYESALALITSK